MGGKGLQLRVHARAGQDETFVRTGSVKPKDYSILGSTCGGGCFGKLNYNSFQTLRNGPFERHVVTNNAGGSTRGIDRDNEALSHTRGI